MMPSAGYAAEMRRIDEDIAKFGAVAATAPIDPERITRQAYRLYQKAAIAGNLEGLSALDPVIDSALPLLLHPGDLYLLKAHAAFKLHKLADVHAALAAVPAVYESHEGRLIRADLDFQHGHYRAAESGYLEALQIERSWDALARLAHLRGKMGDATAADRLLEEAEDQLTAKELRSFAWLEVQRGLLDFAHGRHDAARLHYRRADAAYPGYWLVDEHIAELVGAEGRHGEAIAILEPIVSAFHRPELDQAIGELYELAGQTTLAVHWKGRALTGYQQSVQRGEVHYFHHLADYYTDAAIDGAEAVKWAAQDLQIRANFATEAALAWALHRDGQFGDAACWIDRALSSGVVDARLYFRAGEIYKSAGYKIKGREHLERAVRLNASVDKFHIHH
jgi:tetratricopeptide (TPR) repeat protein